MHIGSHIKIKPLILLNFICFMGLSYASQKDTASLQLSTVNKKVNQLETSLHQAVSNREHLSRDLATTEKAIGEQVQSLRSIQQTIAVKNQSIQNISNELQHLNDKLENQRTTLIKHLRFRYTMGQPHPSEWLLNSEKPYIFSRFMTYYQYLIRSDTQLLKGLQQTKMNIETHQKQLSNELAELNNLQKNLNNKYQTLFVTKNKHQQLIKQLTQHIQTKQEQLASFKQDQARLQALIEQLSRAAIAYRPAQNKTTYSSPSLTLNRKFRSPLQGDQRIGKAYNQGILFSAKEGTPVTSILPGQVVFSDWLNGYGLLLIIDHGHGMMSLYAHNESLFKKKGMSVKSGEEIATVGHTGGIRESGLYFELRQRGKVVPPRQWLV
jgi:murein hydrolase activator